MPTHRTSVKIDDTEVTEAVRVLRWREDCLELEGIPHTHAERLAASQSDLHKMLHAWERGCDADLLCEIFA